MEFFIIFMVFGIACMVLQGFFWLKEEGIAKVMELLSGHDVAMKSALDVLEKNGMKAYYYIPPVASYHDQELSEAVSYLAKRGHIIFDNHGNPQGGLDFTRVSAEEAAQIRRGKFQVVR